MKRRRRSQTTCTCTAYHFPHRLHSGACAAGDMPYALRRELARRGPGVVKCSESPPAATAAEDSNVPF